MAGWRHVKCTDRHTAVDYAQVLKELSEIHFPKAMKIVLVQDNLNTHEPASLYEVDTLSSEARRSVAPGSRSVLLVSGFRLRAPRDFSIPSCRFGRRGITPAFGYGAPHPSAGGT
jgi:hypothetical protein